MVQRGLLRVVLGGLLGQPSPSIKGLSLTIWSFNFGGKFCCHKAAYYLVCLLLNATTSLFETATGMKIKMLQ